MPNTNIIEKINALMSIDYNLKIYIEKHRAVLLTYGHSVEEASQIIIDRIKSTINEKDIVVDDPDSELGIIKV